MSYCVYCGSPLDNERVSALEFLGKLKENWNCIKCAQNEVKTKMIFTGLSGISNPIVSDKIGPVEHFIEPKEPIFNYEENGEKIEELIEKN